MKHLAEKKDFNEKEAPRSEIYLLPSWVFKEEGTGLIHIGIIG